MMMKKRTRYLITMIFLFIGAPVFASVPETHAENDLGFDSIPVGEKVVNQKSISSLACGPTALFYALKLGSSALRAAYVGLAGANDEMKLKDLVENTGAKPSKTSFHKSRFDKEDGTAPVDLLAMANDLTRPRGMALQSQIFNRQAGEVEPGHFIKRVHDALQASIVKGVPVISMFLPYVGIYRSDHDTNEWSEHNGHFVLITGVPHRFDESSLGFVIQFLDPENGKVSQAYIYEEVNREFWARRDNPDGSAHWIHPVVKHDGEEISSPFLGVTAPQLNLAPTTIKHSQRLMITLTTAIGAF